MTGMGSRIAAMTAAAAVLLAGGVVPVAYADEPASAPAADASVCQAGDWDALKACIDEKTGAVTVNLTAMIVVPGDATIGYEAPVIATGADITLAAVVNGAGLTGLASGGTQVKRGGSVFYVAPGGSLTIASGTYSNIHTTDGGALVNNTGVLNITGGTFDSNSTEGNGGVILQNSGSTMISGGTFRNNVASPKGCSEATAATVCLNSKGGGGVIHSIGTLVVSGGEFDHNGATHSHFNSGGGAIWAQGSLTIRNGRDGSIPKFTNNWATVADPTGRNFAEDGILRGGAGGAVFLNGTEKSPSSATITGGEYTGNVSGYLGGAIYTEEFTTTYVGKAVAEQNNAGHFGGGLWFCPSGNSAASKGGNIALFDNTVNPDYDANSENKGTIPDDSGADRTYAGSDLAIMNPDFKNTNYHKNYVNQFQLLDTWFTDRANPAVEWTWDGTPLKESSGYYDSWLPYLSSRQNIRAVLASSKTHSDVEVRKPATLTIAQNGSGPDTITTGLALKANVKGDTDAAKNETIRQEARDRAQLTFKGNSARLSGGAFGSNGVVVFDSPYSMEWNKIGTDTTKPVATASTWLLTATSLTKREDGKFDETTGLTPYFDMDMRPSDCQADDTKADCWGHDNPETTDPENDPNKWYVRIKDNDSHDNNLAMGSMSLDNLAPGTYTLEETEAPSGYNLSGTIYTFTIIATTPGKLPTIPELHVFKDDGTAGDVVDGSNVPNSPKSGELDWEKTDSENAGTPLGDSEWKILDADDKPVKGYGNIQDCTVQGCDGKKDMNPTSGKFSVKLDSTFTNGTYKLVETKAPEGYLQPTGNAAEHTFTVTSGTDGLEVKWGDGQSANIPNTATEVRWTKVGSDATNTPLAGSTWKLTRTKDDGSDETVYDKITDCAPDKDGKETACRGHDLDPDAGAFRLKALKAGSYTLTETAAPDGYMQSTASYTFTISTDKEETVIISGANDENKIVNAKILTALPLTGGRSALDWSVTGGVLALLAGGVAVVADRLRRRAGVR